MNKIWEPCNIYKTAKIGNNVNIGTFTEIGPNVEIGDDTRIGGQCFIPEGVKIGKNVFIGPKVCFTNDKYPPCPLNTKENHKENWLTTIIENNVSIGAGCVILPGVVIKSGAMIGAGSVVTKNIPSNEVWCGNPAKKMK
jgi:UDP-2-acetamido-3-amino-2,3-dideoxy-glucuronate N-acetyltransferase